MFFKGNCMKKLLLHACCAPCSSSVIERLLSENAYQITVFFCNPNIYPLEEYTRRKEELLAFLPKAYPQVHVVVANEEHQNFLQKVKGQEQAPEGGARCALCFRYRLEQTAKYAKEHGFDIFTTTLSVSPHKNATMLNEIGKQLEIEYGVPFLEANFKKQNGYLRSLQLSKEYSLYRQSYCGCEFSMRPSTETNA